MGQLILAIATFAIIISLSLKLIFHPLKTWRQLHALSCRLRSPSVHYSQLGPFITWPRWPASLGLALAGAILALVVALPYLPALAEGSRDLIDSGGSRPWLEDRTGTTAGIDRTNTLKVFARNGETINLGSSAMGLGAGDILVTAPNNPTPQSCLNDYMPGGAPADWGRIDNIAEEQAGPLPAAGGYVPCVINVTAATAGVWEIKFAAPIQNQVGNPPPTNATAPWVQSANNFWIAAWDITVMSGGNPVPGRVFANYLPFNMGNFAATLDSEVFILTDDGYQYRVDLNGQQPFGFIFFANNVGFIDQATGESLYRSVQLDQANNDAFMGTDGIHPPDIPDTAEFITHKIFFNPPDPNLPASAPTTIGPTWLLTSPQQPPVVTGFGFVGVDGTPGRAGTFDLGGNFVFTTTGRGNAQIVIDLNRNGILGDGNDRVLQSRVSPGFNQIFWDSRDGNGNPVPAGPVPYNTYIRTAVGEVHFPFLDVENNVNGFIIERLNGAGAPDATVFFDDRLVGGTAPNLNTGVNSSGGAHAFSNNFGDHKGIDTWAYRAGEFELFQDAVVIAEADLQVQKIGPAQIVAGQFITYTILVTNAGPSNVTGAPIADSLPPQIIDASWSCQVTGGPGLCGPPASGTGSISTTLELASGGTARFTVSGRVLPLAAGTVQNTVIITRGLDTTDPFTPNNTSRITTTIIPGPQVPELQLVKRAVPDLPPGEALEPGDLITYILSYRNIGVATATGVVITDFIPFNTTYESGSATVDTGSLLFIDENDLLQPTEPLTVAGLVWNVGDVPSDINFREVQFTVRVNTTLVDPDSGLTVQYSPEGWIVLDGDASGLNLVSPVETPLLTVTPELTATLEPTVEATPTGTPTATVETPAPTEEATPTEEPAATETLTPTLEPDPPTVEPTGTPEPEPTAESPATTEPEPPATGEATAEPEPTTESPATAEPEATEEATAEPATTEPEPTTEATSEAEGTPSARIELPTWLASAGGLAISLFNPLMAPPELSFQAELTATGTLTTVVEATPVVEVEETPIPVETDAPPTGEPATPEITIATPAAQPAERQAPDYPVVVLEELFITIDNSAVFASNELTPTRSNTTTTPVLRVVDPSLTKEVNRSEVRAGDIVEFHLSMTNPAPPGNAPATLVNLTDPIPAYLEVLSYTFDSSPSGLVDADSLTQRVVSVNGVATLQDTIVLTIPVLDLDDQVTLDITTRVKDFVRGPLQIRNEATMSFAEGAPRTDSVSINVPRPPGGGGDDDDDDDDDVTPPPPPPPGPPPAPPAGPGAAPAPELPVLFLPETGQWETVLPRSGLLFWLILVGIYTAIAVARKKWRK